MKVFLIFHPSIAGGSDWTNVTTCYVLLSSNCYLPLTLLLLEGEQIGVWVGGDDTPGGGGGPPDFSLPPDSNTSFLFLQFMKSVDEQMPVSDRVKLRTESRNGFATRTTDIPDEMTDALSFDIPSDGIYLITANIVFRTADIDKTLLQRDALHVVSSAGSGRRVALRLVNRRDDVLLRMEEVVRRTNYVNIHFTWAYFFRTKDRISLQHSLIDGEKRTQLKVDPSSYFTLLRLTEDEKKFFALDGRFGGGRDISSGEMLWKPPDSKFYWMRDSPYVEFVYLFYPKRSFFALISVTLIGNACPQADKGDVYFLLNFWPKSQAEDNRFAYKIMCNLSR